MRNKTGKQQTAHPTFGVWFKATTCGSGILSVNVPILKSSVRMTLCLKTAREQDHLAGAKDATVLIVLGYHLQGLHDDLLA